MVRRHEPPAPCQSALVVAGRGREHGADLWPPGPTADQSDLPGRTEKKEIQEFLNLATMFFMLLCCFKNIVDTQYVKIQRVNVFFLHLMSTCFPSQSHYLTDNIYNISVVHFHFSLQTIEVELCLYTAVVAVGLLVQTMKSVKITDAG